MTNTRKVLPQNREQPKLQMKDIVLRAIDQNAVLEKIKMVPEKNWARTFNKAQKAQSFKNMSRSFFMKNTDKCRNTQKVFFVLGKGSGSLDIDWSKKLKGTFWRL